MAIRRIVSGGQSGVDRAALDAALALGIACGGWCPRGRRAEDGRIPVRYPLREARADRYDARTRLNVRDSDATLILTRGRLDGGTALTAAVARELGRPLLILDLDRDAAAPAVRDWIARHAISVLNIAGPRESKSPGIHAAARAFVERLLATA